MRQLANHHTVVELQQAARKASSGRVAFRVQLIIRLLQGKQRQEVLAEYGCSSATLNTWLVRYNEEGLAGLEDRPHAGAPLKLPADQHAALKARIMQQPDLEKDGIVRWRIKDIKKLLAEEFEVQFRTEQGVHRFVKSLGFSCLTTRPSHPKKDPEAIATFKKTSATAGRDSTR